MILYFYFLLSGIGIGYLIRELIFNKKDKKLNEEFVKLLSDEVGKQIIDKIKRNYK